jgi:hypothetical protein
MKLLGIISVELHVPNQLLNIHFAYITYWGKDGNSTELYASCLQTSRKPVISVWREVLCNILIEFITPMTPQVLTLNEMRLNEAYSNV